MNCLPLGNFIPFDIGNHKKLTPLGSDLIWIIKHVYHPVTSKGHDLFYYLIVVSNTNVVGGFYFIRLFLHPINFELISGGQLFVFCFHSHLRNKQVFSLCRNLFISLCTWLIDEARLNKHWGILFWSSPLLHFLQGKSHILSVWVKSWHVG